MLYFVRRTGFYGVLPGYDHPWKVDRVHRISRTPFLQFLKRAAEVIKYLAIDVRNLALGRHDRDETGNRLDDEAEVLFTVSIDNCSSKLQVALAVPKGMGGYTGMLDAAIRHVFLSVAHFVAASACPERF